MQNIAKNFKFFKKDDLTLAKENNSPHFIQPKKTSGDIGHLI